MVRQVENHCLNKACRDSSSRSSSVDEGLSQRPSLRWGLQQSMAAGEGETSLLQNQPWKTFQSQSKREWGGQGSWSGEVSGDDVNTVFTSEILKRSSYRSCRKRDNEERKSKEIKNWNSFLKFSTIQCPALNFWQLKS